MAETTTRRACKQCAGLLRERALLLMKVDKADRIIRAAAPPGLHSSSWEEIGRALAKPGGRGSWR